MRGLRVAPACLLLSVVPLQVFAQETGGVPSRALALEVRYSQFTLPNGLHVILHEDHTIPMVTVNVWYHVGSAREKRGRTGLAHLFEHLMFEGSGHVKEGEFDERLEAAGGTSNASTEADFTNYYIDVPSNALDLALSSSPIGWATCSTDESRDASTDSAISSRTSAARATRIAVRHGVDRDRRLLSPAGHPYHWPTIGSMEDLTAAVIRGCRGILQADTTGPATPASSSPATSIQSRAGGWSKSGSRTSSRRPHPCRRSTILSRISRR